MIVPARLPLLAISLAFVSVFTSNNADAGKLTDTFSGLLKKEQYEHIPKDEIPHTLLTKPLADGELSSEFGLKIKVKGSYLPKKHNGIDYSAPTGTKVFAAGEGLVISKRRSKSLGNTLKVSHANRFATVYAHLDKFAENIEEGTEVSRGDLIGYVGSTGQSSHSHLHYELIYRGKRVDPLFEKNTSRFNFPLRRAPKTDTPDD